MTKTVLVRIRTDDWSTLATMYPNVSVAERISNLILKDKESLSKKDILKYIDSMFKDNTKKLEARLTAVIGEF